MTYQELLDEISKLTPEQRTQEVDVCGYDHPGYKIERLWVVEENHIDPSGCGMEPISSYDGSNPEFHHDPDFDWESEPVVCKAGTVLLVEKDGE